MPSKTGKRTDENLMPEKSDELDPVIAAEWQATEAMRASGWVSTFKLFAYGFRRGVAYERQTKETSDDSRPLQPATEA